MPSSVGWERAGRSVAVGACQMLHCAERRATGRAIADLRSQNSPGVKPRGSRSQHVTNRTGRCASFVRTRRARLQSLPHPWPGGSNLRWGVYSGTPIVDKHHRDTQSIALPTSHSSCTVCLFPCPLLHARWQPCARLHRLPHGHRPSKAIYTPPLLPTHTTFLDLAASAHLTTIARPPIPLARCRQLELESG